MKKFKTSLLCIIVAIALIVSIFAVKQTKKENDAFQTGSSYITAENLALAFDSKVTDGNNNTCFTSHGKKDTAVTIDLGEEKEFNSIVLKEDGLNIKSFSILISQDGEQFETIYKSDKIEYHRLCTFDRVKARFVKLFVDEADRFFKLKEIEIYNQQPVHTNNFKRTAYIVNSCFYDILNNEALSESQKHTEIEKMLNSHNFSSLTNVIFYNGISFDKDGAVYVGNPEESQSKALDEFRYMINCMREFGNPDLKISYCIGLSADADKNIAMKEQETLISNMISLAETVGTDGIDIDYEFPQSKEDYQIFGDFLIALKDRMKSKMPNGKNSLLSCAFGTRDIDYPQEVIDCLDMVNMMTYDIFDQDGQHSSFWSCAVQGAKYLESIGFSKEQINIGIPFYGTQIDALMEQYIYKNIDTFNYFENTYTFASYLDGSPTEVYFNSPAMVRDKTAYAMLAGYGGIMVWEFACDTDYSSPYSLWKAVDTAIEQFGGDAE